MEIFPEVSVEYESIVFLHVTNYSTIDVFLIWHVLDQRELIRLQKEHNELLAQRNILKEKKIELIAARNEVQSTMDKTSNTTAPQLNSSVRNTVMYYVCILHSSFRY